MSKAFTKEDALPEPPVTRPVVRLAPGERRYITQDGYERLQRELVALQQQPESRPRADALQLLLGQLTVVPPLTGPVETVVMGARVELEDEDGERVSYRLVGPDEADASEGRISIESPLARALIGRGVGETVLVQRPRGAREYTVRAIHGA